MPLDSSNISQQVSMNAKVPKQVIKTAVFYVSCRTANGWRQFSMIVNHRLLSCQQAVDTVLGLNVNVSDVRC